MQISRLRSLGRTTILVLMGSVMSTSPGSAWAHSGLVAATPSPGTGLPQAPGAVVLRFSEPLNLRLSSIKVEGPSGQATTVGETTPVPGDTRAMQRKLGLLRPGQYTVRWVSVSTLDGHSLRGSYTFGIGTASSGDERVENSPVASEGWLGLLGRLLGLIGLVLWFGFVALRSVAIRANVPELGIAGIGRIAPLLAAAGTSLAVISSSLVSTGSLEGIAGVLSSPSGRLRSVVIIASAGGMVLGKRWRLLGALMAAAAVLAEAGSGHAAVAPVPGLAVGSFAIHLGAVGIWTFAITASLLSRGQVLRVLAAFTPYAVGAAIVTAITGGSNAVFSLSAPSDIWRTAYGKTLGFKTGAFLLMAMFGYLHYFKRRKPDASIAIVRRPLRWESLSALSALIFAVVLVGFPNPPREEEAAEAVPRIDPVLNRLGDKEALSIAGASGASMVSLTLIPPRAGPIQFRVQVVGVEPGDGLRGARLAGQSGQGESFDIALSPCGAVIGCFAGSGRLPSNGVWDFRASIVSNRGILEMEETLAIPAPDGASELARAISSMEAIRSARMREDLRGSIETPLIISEYVFEAPDAFEIRIGDRHEIVIGERSYTDTGSGWETQDRPGLGFSWPTKYYGEFWRGAQAVRVLGVEEVDGVRSRILAFVRPELPAWLRIWVGEEDGLVRRQEMRAEGHIMDHLYRDLNAALDIIPPQ